MENAQNPQLQAPQPLLQMPANSFSMMPQFVYIMPQVSGPAPSGLSGGPAPSLGPAQSAGIMMPMPGGNMVFLQPMPLPNMPLMQLEPMPQNEHGFIEPLSGRSQGVAWNTNPALQLATLQAAMPLQPVVNLEEIGFSARGPPPQRVLPGRSTSPRDSGGKSAGKSDGLAALLDAVEASGQAHNQRVNAGTSDGTRHPQAAKREGHANRSEHQLGAFQPSLKRCGRRPKDLTLKEFEEIYGPSPTMLRQCTNCACRDTPQWRKGPDGVTSLCNRCGVQFRLGRLNPKKNFPALIKISDLPPHERPF